MICVYCDGEILRMTLDELKDSKLNVVVNKTNGYSLDWQEVHPFSEAKIRNVCGVPTVWCTRDPLGEVKGSSSVSFS